ncbi:BTB/POZ and MATH domain-containing protein 2, partial [Dichanthelium oligosanthes]
ERGWAEFMEKSKLRELLLGSNDSFTIRCVLTVIKSRTEDAATIVVPPSDLHRDFAQMLKDADGADVTINVGDRFFLAHRYVLAARSRVFKAQLFGVMKERNTECIQIEDMEPSVFERLLHFIYTDSLSEDFEGGDDKKVAMHHLLVAADRYGLNRLTLMCEDKLCSWIDVQTVATILGIADQTHRVKLKEACLGFIAWPDVLGAVMKTEGFKDLIASYPLIMKEILDKIASAELDN